MNKKMMLIAEKVLNNKEKFIKIMNGYFNGIFDPNMEKLVKTIDEKRVLGHEASQYKKLLDEFFNLLSPEDYIQILKDLKTLCNFKQDLLNQIQEQKANLCYDENKPIAAPDFFNKALSYKQVLEQIEFAETVINNPNFIKLVKFSGKDMDLLRETKKFFDFIEKMEKNPLSSKKLEKIIYSDMLDSNSVFAVRTFDSNKGTILTATTQKEFELSKIIGVPYAIEIDTPGHDVGYHGEIYISPHKIQHTVYEESKNDESVTVVKEKKQKLELLRKKCLANPKKYRERGYIYGCNCGIIVDQETLIMAGIDPESVKWMPLYVRKKKNLTSYDIIKATSNTKMSVINLVNAWRMDAQIKNNEEYSEGKTR